MKKYLPKVVEVFRILAFAEIQVAAIYVAWKDL